LLSLLSELVNRPVVASNISSPAFFRVIAETRPTLLIDEADTFLCGDSELKGILCSGYRRATAFVVRVANSDPDAPVRSTGLASFSSWCPKAMAAIGRFPDTLADRCILIRMHRKSPQENCERLRTLDASCLRRHCARFVADHHQLIASAKPDLPSDLNDRAADLWEPLLALADLAGGPWPARAREAALALSAGAQDSNLAGTLFLDILVAFCHEPDGRLFTRDLVASLNLSTDRPWLELRNGKPVTELWLARFLRPYGIRPHNIWRDGVQAKGYFRDDFADLFRRYIPLSEIQALKAQILNQSPFEGRSPSPTLPPTRRQEQDDLTRTVDG
jgi:putative DNA primase/helicase